MNPPYGPALGKWLAKMAAHQNGIAMIFARTETDAFHRYVWQRADGILFMRGRVNFYNANGHRAEKNAGGPTVLIAYGQVNAFALSKCGIDGEYLEISR